MLPTPPINSREDHTARLRAELVFMLELTFHTPAVLPSPAERQAVRTAGITTAVYDGFEVLHTRSTADTMRLFAQLTAAIQVRIRVFCMPLHWTGEQIVLSIALDRHMYNHRSNPGCLVLYLPSARDH